MDSIACLVVVSLDDFEIWLFEQMLIWRYGKRDRAIEGLNKFNWLHKIWQRPRITNQWQTPITIVYSPMLHWESIEIFQICDFDGICLDVKFESASFQFNRFVNLATNE